MNRMLWAYFKMVPFPPSVVRGFFCSLHCENLGQLLERKLTKVWGPPKARPPVVFLTLQNFVSYSLFFFPHTGSHPAFSSWASAQTGCDSSIHLSWGGSLPSDLSSLMDLRSVVGFQFVQLFLSCEDGNGNFKSLSMQDWEPGVLHS